MRHLLCIALLFGLSAIAARSQASPPSTPDQETVQSADAAFRAGHAAMDQNNLALAHTEFAKVVQLVPQVAAGHSALGAVLYAEGNAAAAVLELEQAHALDPKDDNATLNLGLSYAQLGSFEKALPLFRQLDSAQ